MTLSVGLLDLPSELLERILFHVADPAALSAASRTCKRLSAATAATSPLWPALLRGCVDLTRRPGRATGWETDFTCFWDDSDGDLTDSVAFEPPLARVRGWMSGDVAAACGGGGPAGAAAAAAADEGSGGVDAEGRFLYVDNRRAAGGARRRAPPAADAGASRSGGGAAGRADERPNTAAAAAAAAVPADEDPRRLYAALVAATRAGAVVADPACWALWHQINRTWGSSADLAPPHVWVVRVDPPGIPWPPPALLAGVDADAAAAAAIAGAPPAAEADVIAAATVLLTAAGVAPPILPTIYAHGKAQDVQETDPKRLVTSGVPGDATYMRFMGGPLERFLRDGGTLRGITSGPASADLQRRAARLNDAVRRLLGDRPALVFSFGDDAMDPVGGMVAVAWSPTLIVGLLFELVHV